MLSLHVNATSTQANLESQLHTRQVKLLKLNKALKTVNSQKAASDAEVKAKAAHEADLQHQIDDLNKQLQAKRAAQATLASAVSVPNVSYAKPITSNFQPIGTITPGCGDNSYANFIYMHESGCSTYNPNPSSGACGLGQANPCSKLTAVCPNLDYGCENAWFNGYAASRYGGWAQAYNYWIANRVW